MFTEEQVQRYARHIILPNIGGEGQRKLLDAKVLVIGAGGLGSPVAMYLAAAGRRHARHRRLRHGRRVEPAAPDPAHRRDDVGRPKVESARRAPARDQPDDRDRRPRHAAVLDERRSRCSSRYDVVVDGTDNFPVRYLVNDATQFLGKPLVYGSIYQFEGQATVFMPGQETPCYRCLFPSAAAARARCRAAPRAACSACCPA